MHVHHVPHAEDVESSIEQMTKLEVWSRRHHAVLHLSHDTQVVFCHGYLVFV